MALYSSVWSLNDFWFFAISSTLWSISLSLIFTLYVSIFNFSKLTNSISGNSSTSNVKIVSSDSFFFSFKSTLGCAIGLNFFSWTILNTLSLISLFNTSALIESPCFWLTIEAGTFPGLKPSTLIVFLISSVFWFTPLLNSSDLIVTS